MDSSPELEIAEEADISLNGSLADSQSTFGEGRYRDFDDDGAQKISLRSGTSSRFEDSEEPRLKYDRLSSDLRDILDRDSAATVVVHDKFIVIGKVYSGISHFLQVENSKILRADFLIQNIRKSQMKTRFQRNIHS